MRQSAPDEPPEERVARFIREYRLVETGQVMVVAVSGGPDSVCLLHLLSGLKNELGITLHVAHLNHRLRGDDAEADARFVADLAGDLDVPFTVTAEDVGSYRKRHRISLEEAAREVRYEFLSRVAAEVGAERVAVGHTADDHAETVIMHLVRGSGTGGMRGLQPLVHRAFTGGDLIVIRPLLVLTREETLDYCSRRGLKTRLDASNLSPVPLRNRVRHQIIPLLKKCNPQLTAALLRTSRLAGDEQDFIEAEVSRLRGQVVKKQGNTYILDRSGISSLPAALKRQLLRDCIRDLLGDLKDIEAGHVEDIIDVLGRPAGRTITLPRGLVFTTEYDRYLLGRDPAALSPFPVLTGETVINVPGDTSIPGWEIEAKIVAASKEASGYEHDNEYVALFDIERSGSMLTVRSRRPGDRFQPLGMEQSKKLNRFMMDARIPQLWRRHVPLVVSGGRIIWVVGYRIDECVRVTDDTTQLLRLRFKRC